VPATGDDRQEGPRRPRPFTAADIRGEDRGYVAYHAPRYAYLLELLARFGAGPYSTVLDIGPSRLTSLLRERFGSRVDSLGFGPDRAEPGGLGGGEDLRGTDRQAGRHFGFDLNLAQDEAGWRRDLPRYDFVVMAEVLEHLHTAPQRVLAFVATLLADGGVLVLQTPNAASLPKRIKLLLGRNPYEMIRGEPLNPGHFREYTAAELKMLVEGAGLRVEACATAFYFDARFGHAESGEPGRERRLLGALKNAVYRRLPPPLREGITMVCRQGSAPLHPHPSAALGMTEERARRALPR
jgi:SAM-dependent methyltransferase